LIATLIALCEAAKRLMRLNAEPTFDARAYYKRGVTAIEAFP